MNKRPKANPVLVAYADDHIAVRKGIISYIHDLGGVNVIIEADNGKQLIEKIERSRKLYFPLILTPLFRSKLTPLPRG